MIFVDTNYFLRFLLDDNQPQKKVVNDLFRKGSFGKQKLFTDVIVIFEIYWVVKKIYGVKNPLTKKFLLQVCNLSFVTIDDRQILLDAIQNFDKFNYDLEDAYHYYFSLSSNINSIATFDKKLKSSFKKLSTLQTL